MLCTFCETKSDGQEEDAMVRSGWSQPWVPWARDRQGPRWDAAKEDGGPHIRSFLKRLCQKLVMPGRGAEAKFRWVIATLRGQIREVGGVPRCPLTNAEYVYKLHAFRAPSINRIANRDTDGQKLEYTPDNSTIATASLNIPQYGDPTPIGDLLTGLLSEMREQFQGGDAGAPLGEGGEHGAEQPIVAVSMFVKNQLRRRTSDCISYDARKNNWAHDKCVAFRYTYSDVIFKAMVETFKAQRGRCAISGVRFHNVDDQGPPEAASRSQAISINRRDNKMGHFPHRVDEFRRPVPVMGPNRTAGGPQVVARFELFTDNCELIMRMLQGGGHRQFCRGWLLEIFVNCPLDFGRTDLEKAAAQTELDDYV